MVAPMRLRVTETFFSVQGETSFAGRLCAFVRLTGCDLRCAWCDTPYSFTGGDWATFDALYQQIDAYGADYVCVTGGEPLLQAAVHPFMEGLVAQGKTVSLETGGHRDIGAVDPQVHRIVDFKPPASGECAKMRWENVPLLTLADEAKFVLADRADYEWSLGVIAEHGLADRVGHIHFSPVHGVLDPRQLADWMLADRAPARLQLQLHKQIWGPDVQGV